MSAKATAKVWEYSKAKGSEKLLLLCYADHANDDGLGAYPSMPTLMTKTGLTRQGLTDVRRRLVESGEICIRPDLSEFGTPIIDIVYSDNSNQAIIAAIHGEDVKDLPTAQEFYPDDKSFTQTAKDLPSEQNFCPNDSVVDINSREDSENISTDRPSGQKFYQNGKRFTTTAKLLPPTRSMSELDFNRTLLETAGIQEPALSRLAEKATAEHVSAAVVRAWINSICQLQKSNGKIKDPIAFAISQVDKQGFKPLTTSKPKADTNDFDEIKRRYAGYMRNTGTEG